MKEMQAEADEAAEGADEDEEEVPVKKTKIGASSEVSVGLSKSKVSLIKLSFIILLWYFRLRKCQKAPWTSDCGFQ